MRDAFACVRKCTKFRKKRGCVIGHQITAVHQLALLWLESIRGDTVLILRGRVVCSVPFLRLCCVFLVEDFASSGNLQTEFTERAHALCLLS